MILCWLLPTPRVLASSVTVVTHGFDIWADYFPGRPGGPLRDLGLGLYDYWSAQPGGAVEYLYDPSFQGLTLLRGAAANENKIVVFDWSSDSNDLQAGYDEGSGDVMFAMLQQYNLLNSDYLHLIGHSRGGVVSTQAARRILHYGYDVDQLTLLDVEEGPSPLNEAGPGRAWEGIGYVDNYYGSGKYAGIDIDLGGNQIGGAYNQRVYEDHDDFPEWYTKSISETFGAETGGYYWRVADPAGRPAESPARTPLVAPPDVINGNFSYGISIDDKVAGWWYHGGGGGGHVDLLDVGFEDFDLELDYGDSSKRHSWLYAPEDVHHLEFQAEIGGSWLNDDEFWITLQRYDNYTRRVSPFSVDNTTPWRWYSVDISDFADSVFRFTFAIEAPGSLNIVDSQVEIDNVRFVHYSAGDYNQNGMVDAADYTVWRDTLGSTTDLRANGDDTGASAGVIDQADYALWKTYFGQTAGSGSADVVRSRSAVPEPTTLVLLIFGTLCWLGNRRNAWPLFVSQPETRSIT
jgi:hypothetical protein